MEDINDMEVSHDSKFVAILDDDHHLYLWNLQERQEIWSREISGYTPGQIAFSPDDKYIVCTHYRSIILLDVESGSQLAFLQDDSLSVFRVLFSGEYTIISYNEERRSQQWRIALADAHNNNDLPMVFLPVSGDDLVSLTEIGEQKSVFDDVWILDELGRRVCWIPHDWRCSFDVFPPNLSVSYGNKIALGGESGRVCILNFPEPQIHKRP
jgi:WD40 repeat protein